MAKNHDSVYRQWHLLRQIPRYPQKITVQAIHDYLTGIEIVVDERTIQRDLINLSRVFSLTSDERERPYGWSWQKDVKSFDLPGLTVNEAMTWVLAEQHLSRMLPTSAVEHLSPYFKAARDRLDGEPQPKRGRSWLNKVRTVPPTQPLIPPVIGADVQRAISEALLHEHQVEIHYRRKGERQSKLYQVHPLALIQRGSVLYLYGRLFDHPNARILALHRIEQVKVLEDQPAVAPDGFELDDQLAKGSLGFGRGEQIQVKLRFYEGKGEHLHETPLCPDQQIEEYADQKGVLTIVATVADTPQLKWWLLGFGDGVEVIAPELLRHDLSEMASRMVARYKSPVTKAQDSKETTQPG